MTDILDVWPAGGTATMDVTYTQANAAGGAVRCEISPGAGNEFIVMHARLLNSGTNGGEYDIETAAGGTTICVLGAVASGAGTTLYIGVGATGTSTTTGTPVGLGFPTIISGTQVLQIKQTVAGAQNDTFRVLCNIRCKGAMPSVIHSNSVNNANVSVTAGTEGFATL